MSDCDVSESIEEKEYLAVVRNRVFEECSKITDKRVIVKVVAIYDVKNVFSGLIKVAIGFPSGRYGGMMATKEFIEDSKANAYSVIAKNIIKKLNKAEVMDE